MKTKLNRILDGLHTIREIDDADGSPDGLAIMSRFLGQFGLSAGLIVRLPLTDHPNWKQNILANRWPPEWCEHYLAADHFRHDPCVAKCRRTAFPFLWSEVENANLGTLARLVMQEASEFGLSQGICVPFHAPFEPPTVLSVTCEALDIAPATLQIVGLLAYPVLQSTLKTFSEERRSTLPALTPREREVMRWAAEGKTAWEISCILTVSEHTVLSHQRNVRRKLDATNNVHAVAKAFLRHEI